MASINASARGASLPSLSPTFQTTQMLTPRYLERITIDNPHYRGYVVHSTQTQPHHLNAMQKRVQQYGDNYFFAHKDIPLHQSYRRTALTLSDVRPWDEIVSRPLQSQRVIQKELHLPFPTEHPYTSHISRVAVFPDTTTNAPLVQPTAEPHTPTSPGSRPNTVNVCTQTPLIQDRQHTAASMSTMTPKPATPYYVLHKACERGHRVESRFLSVPAPIETRYGSRGCNLLWDMPRSRRHQRSYTYPAPSLQFGPVTPNTALTVSPQTQEALASIHKTLTRTTTYSEHFPGHSTGVQNILRLEESTRGSHRPHTTESRGKYGSSSRGRTGFTLDNGATDRHHCQTHTTSESQNQEFDFETGNEAHPVQKQTKKLAYASNGNDLDATEHIHNESKTKKEEDINPSTAGDSMEAQMGPPPEETTSEELKASGEHTKMDKATQTDPEDFTQPIQSPTYTANIHSRPESQSRLPHILHTGHLTKMEHDSPKPSRDYLKPDAGHLRYQIPRSHSESESKPPTTGTQFQSLPSWAHGRRPHSADSLYSYTPRTVSSTRRMMSAYDYSKSDALRRFHQQYRETTPDLREYNIREGKRHVIHGSHAYFFH